MMKIVECLWKEQFIEKLEQRHGVSTDEVEEVFRNAPRYDFIAKGRATGENVYRALGQTDAGRYLAIFFVHKSDRRALPISARDMDHKERRKYGKK
jgi:uncharacterized DUF497 family protein